MTRTFFLITAHPSRPKGVQIELDTRLEKSTKKEELMLGTILIVILVLALLGALPRWPHSRSWGYAPTGGLGLILLIVLILLLLGRL
jgi:hypothetical protein